MQNFDELIGGFVGITLKEKVSWKKTSTKHGQFAKFIKLFHFQTFELGMRLICHHNFRNNRMLKDLRIMLE